MDFGFDLDEKLEQLGKLPKAARMGAVAAILVAVLAGYYFLSYSEVQTDLGRFRNQANELQRKLNNARAVTDNLDAFKEEVAGLERQLRLALRQLPNRKQFEDLLRDISTVGKKVGVQIKSIERSDEKIHEFYAEVPFKIGLEGRYHSIALFFERIAKLPRIVNVGSMKVVVSDENAQRTLVRVNGVASTYRFLGDESSGQSNDSKAKPGRV
jgi:type IV pilus assembly protein PilO